MTWRNLPSGVPGFIKPWGKINTNCESYLWWLFRLAWLHSSKTLSSGWSVSTGQTDCSALDVVVFEREGFFQSVCDGLFPQMDTWDNKAKQKTNPSGQSSRANWLKCPWKEPWMWLQPGPDRQPFWGGSGKQINTPSPSLPVGSNPHCIRSIESKGSWRGGEVEQNLGVSSWYSHGLIFYSAHPTWPGAL